MRSQPRGMTMSNNNGHQVRKFSGDPNTYMAPLTPVRESTCFKSFHEERTGIDWDSFFLGVVASIASITLALVVLMIVVTGDVNALA